MAKVAQADGNVTVKLHKRETSGSGYWGHPGICTVTFCTGNPYAAHAALKPRLRAVIDANLWIAGQFVAKQLVHPAAGSDALVAEVLSLQKCAGVTRRIKYPELVKAVAINPAMSVQNGGTTQSKQQRVTKLVVVEPEQAGGEFALVFSMTSSAHTVYANLAGTGGAKEKQRLNLKRPTRGTVRYTDRILTKNSDMGHTI